MRVIQSSIINSGAGNVSRTRKENVANAVDKDYRTLTPSQARQWLIKNDKEGAGYWGTVTRKSELVKCVGENLRDFGNHDGLFFSPAPADEYMPLFDAQGENELSWFELDVQSVSVGFFRGDGDFELLATFNNSGEHLHAGNFRLCAIAYASFLIASGLDDVKILHRADANDVMEIV